jgi:hypothetical protein
VDNFEKNTKSKLGSPRIAGVRVEHLVHEPVGLLVELAAHMRERHLFESDAKIVHAHVQRGDSRIPHFISAPRAASRRVPNPSASRLLPRQIPRVRERIDDRRVLREVAGLRAEKTPVLPEHVAVLVGDVRAGGRRSRIAATAAVDADDDFLCR